jgi:tRNA(Ile)-lysidine synthase
MQNLQVNFNQKLQELLPEKLPKKLAVALSGGVDSFALTFLLKDFCDKNNIEFFAVTIDHKIRKNSSKEALEISKILEEHKIPHQIFEIDKIPTANIEGILRQKRYDLMLNFCKKKQISHLFFGHHIGDISENFLIRLFRGSGLDGLSTIAEISEKEEIKIIRPLLDFQKSDLQNFLKEKKISWFEDETNFDEKFLRNKIRKFFNEFEEKEVIFKRIKRFSDEISEIRDEFDEKMLENAKNYLEFSKNGYFLIDFQKFQKIEERTALKILALILMEIGEKIYKPRLEKLKNFYNYLAENDLKNIKPRNFYGCLVKKYDEEKVIILPEFGEIDSNKNLQMKTVLKKIYKKKN